MKKNIITVEGYTNDLYSVNRNGDMKQTRLFYLIPEDMDGDSETIDLCITSTNPNKTFPIFDEMLDKKIKISVEIIEE